MCIQSLENRPIKWFKHISDSLDDPFIFDLIKQHGADGYLVFFGTLEVYAREFKTRRGWKLEVSTDFLRSKLGYKDEQKMFSVLKSISDEKKWEININENRILIKVPKFNELADNYTLKKSAESGRTPDVHSTDKVATYKEVDKDKEEDTEKNKTLEQDSKIAPTKSKKFKKPTIEELADYAQSIGYDLDPGAFLDHYEAKGWVVGKSAMKEWRASVRTWKRKGGKVSVGKGEKLLAEAKEDSRHCSALYEKDYLFYEAALKDHPKEWEEVQRFWRERWPPETEEEMVDSGKVRELLKGLGEAKSFPIVAEEEL